MAFCSLRSPILANYFLPVNWALCFQWSESLNSNKARLIWLSISTLLLFTYSAFSLWLPHYVENQYKQSNSRNLDERISLIEQAIEKAESDAPFDKAQVVNIFTTVSSILIGVLLIHLASLITVFQSLVKNKT